MTFQLPVALKSTHWPILWPTVAFPVQMDAARPPDLFSSIAPPFGSVTTCQYWVSLFATEPASSRRTSGTSPLPMFASLVLPPVPIT